MTANILLPSKQVTDTLVVTFPFQDQMVFGEVVTGAVVTIIVYTGVDPNPTTMLSGSPDHTTGLGEYVLQTIVNGISGVIYQLVCTVTTSLSNSFVSEGYLAVINDTDMF